MHPMITKIHRVQGDIMKEAHDPESSRDQWASGPGPSPVEQGDHTATQPQMVTEWSKGTGGGYSNRPLAHRNHR
ncbi:hypothetical protein NHX12_007969 [Muraenolepis orangiensis]|uniref:Uncharacterized protein n=1 Tax=Muraenolepis orangiensis TaxID=630683 RepID=A0A9Q0DP04_9TELE|nr:hypothetical protein NHX12_007969 [Muraenolepis orangiensis]